MSGRGLNGYCASGLFSLLLTVVGGRCCVGKIVLVCVAVKQLVVWWILLSLNILLSGYVCNIFCEFAFLLLHSCPWPSRQLLVNYFQGRRCRVKWRGHLSSERLLPGSGAQGSIIGNLEFVSQTNNNADHIPPDNRWKLVDDLTTVEVINMITIGLTSYNFRHHVASDIPVHGQFVNHENLLSQHYI